LKQMLTRRRVAGAGAFLLVVLALTFYSPSFKYSIGSSRFPDSDNVPTSDNSSSEFRRLLSTIYPSDRVPHSKTLGVASRIYVINLKRREDRRVSMETLARAMDITLTWHEATDSSSPIITEILERVRWAREEARKGHEAELQGSDSFPLVFPDEKELDEFLDPEDIDGSELWILPQSSPRALPPLPPPPVPDTRPPLTYVHDRSTVTPYL
jgi:hypothetical protein